MTYTEEFKYKCPVDWTPVTHTITFEKADQIRLFEDFLTRSQPEKYFSAGTRSGESCPGNRGM